MPASEPAVKMHSRQSVFFQAITYSKIDDAMIGQIVPTFSSRAVHILTGLNFDQNHCRADMPKWWQSIFSVLLTHVGNQFRFSEKINKVEIVMLCCSVHCRLYNSISASNAGISAMWQCIADYIIVYLLLMLLFLLCGSVLQTIQQYTCF